jgi:cold shock CspA family protein
MTGTIQSLTARGHSGCIQTESGQSVYFTASAVWEYDMASLAVGRPVSFDLKNGNSGVVTNLRIADEPPVATDAQVRRRPVALRYAGFDQVDDARLYLFQHIVPGEKKKLFVVSAKMSLFVKYHIRIQDGPPLCLYVLALEMDTLEPSPGEILRHELTDQDVLAYLASRPAPAAKVNGKREKQAKEAGEIL